MKHLFPALFCSAALIGCAANTTSEAADDMNVDTQAVEIAQGSVVTCPREQWVLEADYKDADRAEGSDDFAAWLDANAKRKDVQITESGLQYKVVQKGLKDGAKPSGGDISEVHYHGFFANGETFDSSYARNETASFPTNRVIRGWTEALEGMKVCEARILYIPGDLAYGPRGRPGIPPNATLVFNVQLLGVTN